MPFSAYTNLSSSELETKLSTNLVAGLTIKQAGVILAKNGPNIIAEAHFSTWNILLRQFKSAFVYLLIAASALSFLLGEKIDAVMIILFVVINAVLGFYQEYKSEQTIQLLKGYAEPKAKVIRDGVEAAILSRDLVLGDVVIVETGDVLPADLRFFNEHDLTVDESVLTGESIQVDKVIDTLGGEVKDIYVAKNIGFMGTHVASGVARGVVIATGAATEIGKISKLSIDTNRESGFEKQISSFSKFILYLIVGTLVLVFIAHLLIKRETGVSTIELVVFSIALAVGVVPEALPLVTTFALSKGAIALTKKKVVVKRLSSIEDLGSIEILCSDKTGTLTENSMTVAEVFSVDKDKAVLFEQRQKNVVLFEQRQKNVVLFEQRQKNVVLFGALCTANSSDSFDVAFFKKLSDEEKNHLTNYKKVNEIPFDPKRRRNSVLVNLDGKNNLIVRGASESILPYIKNLSTEQVNDLSNWSIEQGTKGRRIIAVATRPNFSVTEYKVTDEEEDLEFLGLVSFEDPIKLSTAGAVVKAKSMKVEIKILTGDSREVAGAVAYAVGITDSPKKVLTGEEFSQMMPEEKMNAVKEFNVFARVSPEQKFNIIELLQKQKFRVGYLGEGINDAPALKIADVALAVEGASDIARQSADIVLLSSNLDVIIDGIEEGRKTFVNTVKYIKSTLASNFGNFYAIAFASLVIDYLPMLPIQILLVNLLSDFPMIAVATDKVEPDELKNPKSYDIKEIILIGTVLGLVSTFFDFVFFGVFHGAGEAALQTNWFIGSILTELLLIFSIRTKKPFFRASAGPSWILGGLSVVAAVVTVVIPMTKFGVEFFKFSAPTLAQYQLVGFIVVCYFVTTEVAKLLYYRFVEKS